MHIYLYLIHIYVLKGGFQGFLCLDLLATKTCFATASIYGKNPRQYARILFAKR